jgi:hypothetical protein
MPFRIARVDAVLAKYTFPLGERFLQLSAQA